MIDSAVRRGRPPGTTRRDLEVIAMRLVAEQGFEETTVDLIATEAGINKRSFFRYFTSKGSVLWGAFDDEVEALRAELETAPAGITVMEASRAAYDRWLARANTNLTVYLEAALAALATGFTDEVITTEPISRRRAAAGS